MATGDWGTSGKLYPPWPDRLPDEAFLGPLYFALFFLLSFVQHSFGFWLPFWIRVGSFSIFCASSVGIFLRVLIFVNSPWNSGAPILKILGIPHVKPTIA